MTLSLHSKSGQRALVAKANSGVLSTGSGMLLTQMSWTLTDREHCHSVGWVLPLTGASLGANSPLPAAHFLLLFYCQTRGQLYNAFRHDWTPHVQFPMT